MSVIIGDKFLAGHYATQTASTGEQVVVFATAGKPAFVVEPPINPYIVDPAFAFWHVTWTLRGIIDLTTSKLTGVFFAELAATGQFPLGPVIGDLNKGVTIDFDQHVVKGTAKFYLKDSWLTIDLKATVLGLPHNPATVKLVPVPAKV